MSEHAKLPWHVGPYYSYDIESGSGRVGTCQPFNSPRAWANASFIVKACNAHYDLLEACKAAEAMMRKILRRTVLGEFDETQAVIELVKAAITKATT